MPIRFPAPGSAIGAWPREPGVAEAGNREALGLLAGVRCCAARGCGGDERGRVRIDEHRCVRHTLGAGLAGGRCTRSSWSSTPVTARPRCGTSGGRVARGRHPQSGAGEPAPLDADGRRADRSRRGRALGPLLARIHRHAGSARRCCSAGPRWCSPGWWCRPPSCSTCTRRCTGCACRICGPARWRTPRPASGPLT